MAEIENHFTVFVRLPFKRGEFVDPPPVSWSAAKERELWDIISRQTKGNHVDWNSLAVQFHVTQQFLLQQAAWLYERQLSQVRAQMRRMGSRQSATASPVPGSASASIMATQPVKRNTAIGSKGASRLSTQMPSATTPTDTSVPSTPARSRTSLPLKSTTSVVAASTTRAPIASRPLSRKSSKENESSSRAHSRRGSIQHYLSRSPGDIHSAELTSSEDENLTKASHRRPNPATTQRRASTMRKSQQARTSSTNVHQLQEECEEDDAEDDPTFLPFANPPAKAQQSSSTTTTNDPSATLRSVLPQPTTVPSTSTVSRPTLQRNQTSERVKPITTYTKPKDPQPQAQKHVTSSTSSLSSNNAPNPPPPRPSTLPIHPHRTSSNPNPNPNPTPNPNQPPNLPTPLSPRQQAALAAAAGLSPRRRSANPTSTQGHGHSHGLHGNTGSESSPSMGSSFSDLDDASVTQSALEEALMSNMNTMGSTTVGGLGSRVSGISQALRSRYFDARGEREGQRDRGGNGNGGGEGR